MSTVITWTISHLECYPQRDDLDDVVFNVHWRCSGVDGDHAASVYATCAVAEPEEEFTPYADLTEADVLAWIWSSGVDKDATEAAVEAQIANLKNPPTVSHPLPWSGQ